MRIDFHVHMFPEALAKKTLPKLAHISGRGGQDAPYFTDGTLPGTLRRLDEWGVDRAVTLHIATSVHAMHKVNDFAAAVKSERLYSFGSVHPDAPDALEELDRIQALGLDGVKFHPDYQDFFVDDDKMAPIYEKIQSLGLPVTFHAGWDPLSPEVVHAEPERLARVLDAKKALNVQRTEDYRTGTCARAGGVVDPLPEDAPFSVKDYYEYYKTQRGYPTYSKRHRKGGKKSIFFNLNQGSVKDWTC